MLAGSELNLHEYKVRSLCEGNGNGKSKTNLGKEEKPHLTKSMLLQHAIHRVKYRTTNFRESSVPTGAFSLVYPPVHQ
jgi:hypothetical protein